MNVFTKYIQMYDSFIRSRVKETTAIRKNQNIRFFLTYLKDHGFSDLYEVRTSDIYAYINSLNFRPQTISLIEFELRMFFNFFYEKGMCTFDGYKLFPVIFTNKRDSILSYYSTEEISLLISSFNTSFRCGLRDKCMTLIAAQTGLRAGDIVYLKKDEIKWDKNVIEKIQSKTGVPIIVPINEQLKFLLLDYLKNERPQSDSEYIFINTYTNSPFKSASIMTTIVNKQFKRAGIVTRNKKSGAHSLRHSLATNMLKNNTPLPIITGVLGHTTMDTTTKYISVDVEGLRSVSLEIDCE